MNGSRRTKRFVLRRWSLLWWSGFILGIVLLVLLSESIFGKDSDGAALTSFIGGALWAAIASNLGRTNEPR
jgi:hypothetical protein